ncbi:class I SAM-dependent methyltransferase [Pseudobutyrivibrio xylanivorans]|uniref:Class I SAM-dependent methyltransferase n=1 Tax=Pseudobutyrivibrio xylanivorans TaxID=185007 RepID=A0A5P6VN16_PSEXY|nr:class I SAM-dependent methyltransferase [Pseudobutyrivibrio xylanivorans]QFJ54066.1 class I SAM-dependent methyltransferase [Pseudobutyrivibrio xylanivorans]
MTNLEEYYNKFNEDKRLKSRHGIMEFTVTMKYVHKYLDILERGKIGKEATGDAMGSVDDSVSDSASRKAKSNIKILDIGAATGGYSIPLWNEGYDVTAVELVKHNLGMLKAKGTGVKAFQGNALKLKRFEDNSFDLTLLFGPMYHLKTYEEQLQALLEAKRVTRPGGYILVAYVMNEYAFLTYGIKEGHVLENIAEGKLDEAYHVRPGADDLYAFMRTEDIEALNEAAGVRRVQIISPDGPANHMRREVNALSEEQFAAFIRYQMAVCERADLLGASAHTVDILQK